MAGSMLLSGSLSELLFLCMVYGCRRYDMESQLPKPSKLWTALACMLPAMIVFLGAEAVGSALFFSYAVFGAYTDRHTMYLYTITHYIYGFWGIVWLICRVDTVQLAAAGISIACFFVWILISYYMKAVNSGDIGLFLTTGIWMMAFVKPAFLDRMGGIMTYMEALVMLYITSGVSAFVCHIPRFLILKDRKNSRTAFAPYVLAGSTVTLLYLTCPAIHAAI